jgi:hypothetical protein
MHPLRVFVSYAEPDRRLVESLVGSLRHLGLRPTWAQDIGPGRLFLDAIKEKIATAHLFMPVLTSTSSIRPWLHQETGFALGINVPVLPVAVDSLPAQMLAGLQALIIKEDASDLSQQVQNVDFESVALPAQPRPPVLYSVADFPETRTDALVSQGLRLVSTVGSGRVRQRALFSSFSIPDEVASARVWSDLDREQPRGTHYRDLLRQERSLLENQAKLHGCTLIITPIIDPQPVGSLVHRIRIETLIGFMESLPDELLDVVLSERCDQGNETILGDVLLARAVAPQPHRDYWQTLLTSHAPTVLSACRAFDTVFLGECNRQGLELGHSRVPAIDALRARLRQLS